MKKLAIVVLALASVSAFASDFTNSTNVRLPGTGTGGTATGSAGLYPIPFLVSGLGSSTTSVSMTLNFGTSVGTTGVLLGEEHTFASDLDIMLVAPTGQRLIFLSDAGGGNDLNGSYTFADGFAALSSAGTTESSGGNILPNTFGVSQYSTGDIFLAPSPGPDYTFTTFAGAFNGLNPNGTWNMWIMDDAAADAGWLMSSTLHVNAVPEPATFAVLGLGVAAFFRKRRKN